MRQLLSSIFAHKIVILSLFTSILNVVEVTSLQAANGFSIWPLWCRPGLDNAQNRNRISEQYWVVLFQIQILQVDNTQDISTIMLTSNSKFYFDNEDTLFQMFWGHRINVNCFHANHWPSNSHLLVWSFLEFIFKVGAGVIRSETVSGPRAR